MDIKNVLENDANSEFLKGDIIDYTPEELSKDIQVLDKNFQLLLTEGADRTLSRIIEGYNEVYGTNFSIESIQGFLNSIPELSKTDVKALEILSKDISYKVALIMKMKAIVTNAILIDRALELIKDESKEMPLNEILVGMITQIFKWIERIEQLKSINFVPNIDIQFKGIEKEKYRENNRYQDKSPENAAVINKILEAIKSGG